MGLDQRQFETADWSIEIHLLAQIDFDSCLALQLRLVDEIGGRDDGRIAVLLCEHSPMITVGRTGSRGHVRLSDRELRRRQLPVRWVNRSGGCVLHSPGQLAVYPIVPLRWHGWTSGEYRIRLRQTILGTLSDLQMTGHVLTGKQAIAGRSGPLATIGVSVKNGIAMHGFFVNVNPNMQNYGFVDVVSDAAAIDGKTTMGCLLAERRRPARMPQVRAALIARLAESFGCQRYHLHTGHPLLRQKLHSRKSTVA